MNTISWVRLFLTALACGLLVAIQGCAFATAPSVPVQTSMDEGILTSPVPKSKASKVLNGEHVDIAVILSGNTKKNIKFLQDTRSDRKGHFALTDDDEKMYRINYEEADPTYIIDWITKSMTTNFGRVRFYDTQEAARSSHPQVFAILNVVYTPVLWWQGNCLTEIKIEFFDHNLNYIGTAEGTSTATISGDPLFHYKALLISRTQALTAMDQSMASLLVKPVSWYPTTARSAR